MASLTCVSKPASMFLPMRVKEHLRVDGDYEDIYLADLTDAATAYLDGPDGRLGRALVTQTWRLELDAFSHTIELPLPPCQSVTSLTYIDAAGASQTMAANGYTVAGLGSSSGASIRSAFGNPWPSVCRHPAAVTVTFTAGYGAPADVPADIRNAVLAIVGDKYAVRETIGENIYKAPVAASVEDVIAAYKVRAV